MKLLLAADIFPPDIGGPATYVVTLANAFQKQGMDVRIVSLNPDSDTSIALCPIYAVTSHNKIVHYMQYLGLLYRYAKDVDVVYAMGPVNAGLPSLIVSFLRRKKLVIKVVGDYAWEQGTQRFGVTDLMDEFQKKTYGWKVQLLRFVESFTTRHAQLVITPCEYLKKIVVGWGVRADHVQVIYNAVDVQAVPPAKKPAGERWIVSSGRMTPWKGMETLVRVMAALTKEFPDVRLKLIGDGPEFQTVKKTVQELQLASVVELLGSVSRNTALSYVHAADAFVLNSGYEGLSHALIEALSFDRPVFASDAGGDNEVVIPGKTGTLFPYNDAEEITRQLRMFLQTGQANNEGLKTSWRQEFFARFAVETLIARTRETLECV